MACAPGLIYPGSIAKFYTFTNDSDQYLQLKYGNENIGYTIIPINPYTAQDGRPYEVTIFGNYGEAIELFLIGKWYGKVFLTCTLRIRDRTRSWEEEER